MKKAMLVLLFAAACGKSTEKGPPLDPPVGSGSAPADGTNVAAGSGSGSGSGSAAPAADVDVPTSMDYEELANEEITDKTVEARLKELETELAPQ
jgi:hypothetical protein